MRISRRAASLLLASTALQFGAGSRALAVPDLLRRADWGAKAPAFGMRLQTPVRLTIHHTGTRQRPDRPLARKLRNLQGFSQREERLADGRLKRAWADIPYHYYIGADGVVAEGRETRFKGDTNTNYDPQGHIGIAVEGNFEVEHPTEAQITALVGLISYLSETHRISVDAVAVHQTFASTACPGRAMVQRMPEILGRVSGGAKTKPRRRRLDRSSNSPRPHRNALRP